MGTYRLTAHSFAAIRLFLGFIIFTPGTQLKICFVNPCNFRILDRFKCMCSWLSTAVDIWNGLPADLILQGEVSGWCTILKDVQCCVYT